MPQTDRRTLLSLAASGAAAALFPAIVRAAAVAPDVRSGTINDVDHVVILMQENRGFDHYFGTLRGVRGFADRLPIPVPPLAGETEPATVWQQRDRTAPDGVRTVLPFHLETRRNFDLMRMEGTPHTWPDAQRAWDGGRMAHWPEAKSERAMGHYRREDIPFQFALAEAFTICDAYHCSVQTGTNTNRLFLWSGTNDPSGTHGGPAIGNSHDALPENGGYAEPYRWTTTVERLQAAGVDWRIYQDMADNFGDNPLVGFERLRAAYRDKGHSDLRDRALASQALTSLKADVLAGRLPQVSYIIATARGSEHPGPSSPAQGAAYTAEILDALTADPKVWARTALFVMFDENDGFFDHMPPPAPPARRADGRLLGGATTDLSGEYHDRPSISDHALDLLEYRGCGYGLGPRVPMYVVSPWSRGGWVNSQVFDHTSVTRFLERRFGIRETNISAWRRAVCGDLTTAFDFAAPANAEFPPLPDPRRDAGRADRIPDKNKPKPGAPRGTALLWQDPGVRKSRPSPYSLAVEERLTDRGMELRFLVGDGAAAVFHVYDRSDLAAVPRRYTVEPGKSLDDLWRFDAKGAYDLWVLGPNGFHRHFTGHRDDPRALSQLRWRIDPKSLRLVSPAGADHLRLTAKALRIGGPPETRTIAAQVHWPLDQTLGWYDLTVTASATLGFSRRLSGRADSPGRVTTSDPFGATPT